MGIRSKTHVTYISLMLSSMLIAFASDRSAEKRPPSKNRTAQTLKLPTSIEIRAIFTEAMELLARKDDEAAHKNAVLLLKQAAEVGHVPSQAVLGDCYRDGTGVPKDCDESLKWYLKAAEAGNALAQWNLAGQPGKCPGVPDDTEKAKWLKRAAEQGNVESCLSFAASCNVGKGVPKSIPDAYIWYSIAAALPGQYKGLAAFMRDQTAKELSQTTLESAQERSQKLFEEITTRMEKNNQSKAQ